MTDLRKGLSTSWVYPDHNAHVSNQNKQVEMTEVVDGIEKRVPTLLLDAADPDSPTAGLSQTILRVNHRTTYLMINRKVLIGGKRDATD